MDPANSWLRLAILQVLLLGEISDLKNTVKGMVVRLRALAAEATRVTLEVGSQGQGTLSGQACTGYRRSLIRVG